VPVIVEWFPETNEPPVATIHIDPFPSASVIDTLVLTYHYYDPNDDPEQGSLIYWFRSAHRVGELDGSMTVPYTYLIEGQYWYAMVRPRDSRGMWGKWAVSNVVWIVRGEAVGYRPPGVYPNLVRPQDIGNV
jgi:hypothetical protein